MADAFLAYNVTCQPNVTQTAPTVALNIGAGPWQVERITLVIPAGHAGLTGIQFWFGGNAVIPYNGGWYSGDDDKETFDVGNDFPVGVPWSVAMINNDYSNAHSWQTRWEMNFITANAQSDSAASVAVSDIYSAAGMTTDTGQS